MMTLGRTRPAEQNSYFNPTLIPGLLSSYVSPWIEVSQKRLFGYVHKYQFDCRQIVEIWYECYKIICDIIG